MSLATAVLTPLQPERAAPLPEKKRHLRPLERPARVRKPRIAYALTALFGLLLIGIVQMGMSLATTATTYEIRDLTAQQRDLTMQTQLLKEELVGLSSPQYLAANAAALGMVVGASPTYLRLSDGAIVGTGEVATQSSVNVLRTAGVPNTLIANTPLVTAPLSSIGGALPPETTPGAGEDLTATVPAAPEPALPPAISGGLPTPETR